MDNSGTFEVTFACPSASCSADNTVVVFGYDGTTIFRVGNCIVCGQDYQLEVDLTAETSATGTAI